MVRLLSFFEVYRKQFDVGMHMEGIIDLFSNHGMINILWTVLAVNIILVLLSHLSLCGRFH